MQEEKDGVTKLSTFFKNMVIFISWYDVLHTHFDVQYFYFHPQSTWLAPSMMGILLALKAMWSSTCQPIGYVETRKCPFK